MKFVKESSNRYWMKYGKAVWLIQKTPYKEIPIVLVNWEDLTKPKKPRKDAER